MNAAPRSRSKQRMHRCLPHLAIGVLLMAAPNLHAAQPTNTGGVSGGFSLPMRDDQGRLRTLVQGNTVKAIEGFTLLQLGGLKITTYKTNGTVEFIGEAPDCLYDTRRQIASSPGPFQGRAADGRAEISGVGFEFRETNSFMRVSNSVRTILRRLTNAPAATGEKPLVVSSDTLDLDLGRKRAVYTGRVRADDPQMELTASTLAVRLADKDGAFDVIEAEGNVVISGKNDRSRATAQRAMYDRASDRVELFGNPVWRQGAREAAAEKMSFNRADRSVQADGRVVLKLPREALGPGGLLSLAAPTNAPAGAPQIVQVFSEHFQSRSNLTVADGSVRVIDGTNRLTCERLTLRSATTDPPEDSVVAEGGVVIEQGSKRVTAARAEYNRTNDTALFTGRPQWKLEDMEGSSDSLKLRPRAGDVEADGGVFLKLLRGARGAALFPAFPPPTNALTTPIQAASTNGASPPIEVSANRFTLKERLAVFTGAVRAKETGVEGHEPRLNCAALEIKFAAATNRAESAIASGGVTLEHGLAGITNGPAAYQRLDAATLRARMDPATGALAGLVAEQDVIFRSAQVFAAGDRMTYDAANDALQLLGNPFFINDQIMIYEAQSLTVDRRSGQYRVGQPAKIQPLTRPARESATPGAGVN